MLKEGHKLISGLDEAVLKNIEACMQVSKITSSSLGPNGEPLVKTLKDEGVVRWWFLVACERYKRLRVQSSRLCLFVDKYDMDRVTVIFWVLSSGLA